MRRVGQRGAGSPTRSRPPVKGGSRYFRPNPSSWVVSTWHAPRLAPARAYRSPSASPPRRPTLPLGQGESGRRLLPDRPRPHPAGRGPPLRLNTHDRGRGSPWDRIGRGVLTLHRRAGGRGGFIIRRACTWPPRASSAKPGPTPILVVSSVTRRRACALPGGPSRSRAGCHPAP